MDDLLTDFVAETREMLEASAGELVAWEADPSDTARLDAIFRFVHTVKGNCGFFDFPQLEKLSHAAESVLAEIRAGHRKPDALLVNAVLAIIDRIGEMADCIEAGEPLDSANDERLIAALEPGETDLGEAADCHQPHDDQPRGNAKPQIQRSIRLPVDLLDRVMSGVSDLVLARNDLARRLRSDEGHDTIEGPFDRLSSILTDVREAVTRMRMQRIAHLFGALPRMVRDLSAELGKQVMLDIEGADVELDREMIENIRDPLTHLIRNAVDHGIEDPAQRRASGKREIGLLTVTARQSGNRIAITITDDGAGLNPDAIAQKAIESGLATAAQIAAMSRDQILQLIFEPGLTTKEVATSVSGRGVGMDVVRANLERIGGTIRTASTVGEGTVITLEIPLTLSMISALTVGIGDHRFAIPRSFVEEIVHSSSSALDRVALGQQVHVTFRGNRIACLSGAEAIGLPPGEELARTVFIMVRLSNDSLFAFHVDRIFDHEDLVVKPLAPVIMQTRLYAGTTLLDDGRPILMLDIASIAQLHNLVDPAKTRSLPGDAAETQRQAEGGHTMLVFEDFHGRRTAAAMDLVRRIETVAASAADFDGAAARIVVDGSILPLEGIAASHDVQGDLRLIHMSDGQTSVMFAARRIVDTLDIAAADMAAITDGKVLIGGEVTALIDGFDLFSRHHDTVFATGDLRTCRLPPDDDWAHTVLAPLVRQAGYVIVDDPSTRANIAFTFGPAPTGANHSDANHTDANHSGNGSDEHDGMGADTVIHLRKDAAGKGAGTESIYRYDRDALLAALHHHAGAAA